MMWSVARFTIYCRFMMMVLNAAVNVEFNGVQCFFRTYLHASVHIHHSRVIELVGISIFHFFSSLFVLQFASSSSPIFLSLTFFFIVIYKTQVESSRRKFFGQLSRYPSSLLRNFEITY